MKENMSKYHQGKFRPKNPEKYKGDIHNIVYRSSWELRFLKFCDNNKNIIEYASEEIIIPYFSPLDGKTHRYFVDFYIKVKNSNNIIKKYLIEVKPKHQTVPPKKPKRMSKKYQDALKTYAVNEAKWNAAKRVCDERDWSFMILTEDHLT